MPLPAPSVTGSPRRWAFDYALVGASSGFFALYGVFGSMVLAPALFAGLVGALSGAVLGRVAPKLLDKLRGRVPIPVIAALGVPLGFVWGALTGLATTPVLAYAFGLSLEPFLWPLTALTAGLAGALQLGWLWFPYTFQSVVHGRRWPLVAVACLVTPWLGVVASTLFALVLT